MPDHYRSKRRIEFADTDMAGIVHFSRFFVFMEAAEHEYWRHLGLSVHLERDGDIISWPRMSASCDYRRPARFEDELDIDLRIERQGGKTLTYQFEFFNGDELLARGQLKTICCICNPGEDMRAVPIPDYITAKIAAA
jgi:acyl-CoA thioester hydrolase